MDNFDFLSEVFNDYCVKNNLPLNMSADDILHGNNYGTIQEDQSNLIDLTEDQIQWIKRFIIIWEEITEWKNI